MGAFLANITAKLLIYLKVDDAVGATCVHGFGGAWGMIAVGIFARDDPLEGFNIYPGLIHGGGFYLLGIQTLTCVCLIIWSSTVTIILIFVRKMLTCVLVKNCRSCPNLPFFSQSIDKFFIHFRLTEHEELLGADYTEHNVHHPGVGVTRAVSVLKRHDDRVDLGLVPVGRNLGHMEYLENHYGEKLKLKRKKQFYHESGLESM